MTGRVHSNPDHMRAFRHTLALSIAQLENTRRMLINSLNGTDWNDSQRMMFEQEFQSTMLALLKFVENCERKHIVYLDRQITTLEEYRNRR